MLFRQQPSDSLQKERLRSEIFFTLQPFFFQKDVAKSGEARKVTRSLVTVERIGALDLHVGVGH